MRMIERVARAISCGAYHNPDTEPDDRRAYRDQAVAALNEIREPSLEMIKAGYNNVFGCESVHYIFMAMIDAALKEAPDANDR